MQASQQALLYLVTHFFINNTFNISDDLHRYYRFMELFIADSLISK